MLNTQPDPGKSTLWITSGPGHLAPLIGGRPASLHLRLCGKRLRKDKSAVPVAVCQVYASLQQGF